MIQIIKNSPIILFIYLSVVLTQSSILFPQNIGRFQKVAGWPLSMYKVNFKYVGGINSSGRLVRRVKQTSSKMMWERVFVNILIWTALFQGTWWTYHMIIDKKKIKLSDLKTPAPSS